MRRSLTSVTCAASSVLLVGACNAILGNEAATLAVDAGTVGVGPIAVASATPDADAGSLPDATESACGAAMKMCDGLCVPRIDPRFGCVASRCAPCELARATSVCSGSACAIGACDPGYASCDLSPENGCETDLSTAKHCGSCNAVCPPAAPYCAPSGTTFACTTGCTGVAPTLCGDQCVDLGSNATHCGSCTAACPAVANGKPVCAQGACKISCSPAFHACGAACASDVDPGTCGASCAPCPAVANGVATCVAGACGFACKAGFHACGGACASNTTPATCGGACTPCPEPLHGNATCTAGVCGINCATSYHLCVATCMSKTDPASCGASCAPCPTGPNATASCNGISCGLVCALGFGDCDANPATGCEIVLLADPANCGACGHSCAGLACRSGVCDLPPPPDAGQDSGPEGGPG